MRASRLRLHAAEHMMSSHDYLSLIKRQAKLLAKTKSIKLSAAQAHIASSGGFDHYHELQKVAKHSPNDIRLMRLALQTDELAEVVYGEYIYSQIDSLLEDELSSEIASTNAEGFYIDELAVEKAEYDQNTGVLSINADISYTGDQMPDRPYSGTAFKLEVIINLFRQVSQWEFWDDDAFRIISIVSDQDLDWQQQLEAKALKNDPSYLMAEALKNDPSYLMAEVSVHFVQSFN